MMMLKLAFRNILRNRRRSLLTVLSMAGGYLLVSVHDQGYAGVMIGAQVARQLALDVGDELILVSQGADGSLANDLYRVQALTLGIRNQVSVRYRVHLSGVVRSMDRSDASAAV